MMRVTADGYQDKTTYIYFQQDQKKPECFCVYD